MKNNINKISLFAFILLVWSNNMGYGQSSSVGFDIGMLKQFDKNMNPKLGACLTYKFNINDNINIGVNIGKFVHTYKIYTAKYTESLTPFTLLFEYLLISNKFSPYIGADFGYYYINNHSNTGYRNINNKLGLAPTCGVYYNISKSFYLNCAVKYHHLFGKQNNLNAINVNVGLGFKF